MADFSLNPLTNAAFIRSFCESDTSAWCFIPVAESHTNCCSKPFRDLWHLPVVHDASIGFSCEQFSAAFHNTSVHSEEFFTEVRQHRLDTPHRIRIRRNDGVTIYAAVTCVFNSDDCNEPSEVSGWLIRFHVQSTLNAIDVLLDDVNQAQRKLEILSDREREILGFVYEGRTNKSISIVTGISEKTVEKHRARISMKLGLNSSTMLIRMITIARMLPDQTFGSNKESADSHQRLRR